MLGINFSDVISTLESIRTQLIVIGVVLANPILPHFLKSRSYCLWI